jgi:hypothetical protein
VRQRLLDAIYAGQPFRTILRDLGLTPNQVWGLTKTDDQWAGALETALTATRRDDLKHGTTGAYVRGCVCSECRDDLKHGTTGAYVRCCVCSECREYQRIRMARQSI